MSAPKKTWTAQETELAQTLMHQRASNETFEAILGRSKKCAESKLRRHNDHLFGNVMKIGHYAGDGNIIIPPEVIEERNKRLMARYTMDLTAKMFGDPEPGRARL